MACITLDPYTGEYAYSLAGHPPPLLLDETAHLVTRLEAGGGPPLGFATSAAIEERIGTLPGRATLVAYTDGLVERRSSRIDEGIDHVAAVLVSSSWTNVEQLADEILAVARAGADGDDDAAFVIVRAGGAPARIEFEIAASPPLLAPLRRRLQTWLTLRGVPEESAVDAILATHEACINAIEHAYAGGEGTIRLTLEHEDGTLGIVVEDRGRWRMPRPDPTRGRGTVIMRSTMDTAQFEDSGNGTRVALRQRLS
jgi:anti-sigma regulatory factor (Ser/Thr protein kinase)